MSGGSILVDGINIDALHINTLRSGIGFVSQDMYLVEGTIKDNISYGTPGATFDEIKEAAKKAQAHDFIIKLPEMYDTKIQEFGKNLSGGQKQRLSIARALLKKPAILIFDEATSAIDNQTEAAIQETILELSKNHTIIIIAHRLSTVRSADKIFVLEKGIIIEQRSHYTLIAHQGMYAQLSNKQ